MKHLKLFTSILATVFLTTTVCCITEYSKKDLIQIKAKNGYTCADITFSETVSNPGARTDIDGAKIGTLTNFIEGNITFSNWTNANYKTGISTSAIKIGGTKTTTFNGSFTVSSSTYVFDKVIVYACGWSGDNATQLVVNGVSNDIPKNGGKTYSFLPYTFEFTQTNTLTFTNNANASNKQRVAISKIVFRTYIN